MNTNRRQTNVHFNQNDYILIKIIKISLYQSFWFLINCSLYNFETIKSKENFWQSSTFSAWRILSPNGTYEIDTHLTNL